MLWYDSQFMPQCASLNGDSASEAAEKYSGTLPRDGFVPLFFRSRGCCRTEAMESNSFGGLKSNHNFYPFIISSL